MAERRCCWRELLFGSFLLLWLCSASIFPLFSLCKDKNKTKKNNNNIHHSYDISSHILYCFDKKMGENYKIYRKWSFFKIGSKKRLRQTKSRLYPIYNIHTHRKEYANLYCPLPKKMTWWFCSYLVTINTNANFPSLLIPWNSILWTRPTSNRTYRQFRINWSSTSVVTCSVRIWFTTRDILFFWIDCDSPSAYIITSVCVAIFCSD